MNCIIGGDRESCKIIEELVKKSSSLNLTGTFSDPESFRNQLLQSDGTGLVFVDIDTLRMDIFEFVKSLSPEPNIIMISSSDQNALKAFEMNVVDYLIKPVAFPRFYRAIDKAIRYYSHKETGNKLDNQIFIKKGTSLVKLKIKDIVYIEALENYVTLNTIDARYLIHFTMKGIENQLPSGFFYRIHRSFIVNKSMIQSIDENSLDIIIGDTVKNLPVGKSYRDLLMNNISLIRKN